MIAVCDICSEQAGFTRPDAKLSGKEVMVVPQRRQSYPNFPSNEKGGRFPLLARLRHPAMSALRSLTGGKRTWRGQPISVENDPIPDLGGRRTVSFDHLVGCARHRMDNGERRPSIGAPHRLMKKP